MKNWLFTSTKAAYFALIYLFLYSPIVVLIVYSFNESKYSLIWHGFTLDWYRALFSDSNLWIAGANSMTIALLASTIATFIGTIAAVSLYRYRSFGQFFGKKLLHGLIFILIISPDIVLGISLLLLFSLLQINFGFTTLLIAHITFCIPFAAMTVLAAIRRVDKNIFEAAKDLGATERIIFFRIMVPILWPALLASWLLSFTLSFDDVIISYFVAGPTFEILPLKIYSLARLGVKPDLNALCAVIFIITLVLVSLSQLILRKRR
jgi:spermidine/putrescine transport system permease protein